MKLSDSEWAVMKAVWQQSPASVRDVLERIEGETGWAYTTVKTMLERLTEKGALRVRKRANASYFEPAVTQKEARKSAVRSLIDRAFDGTFGSLLQHLVAEEKLSTGDRQRLAEMLDKLDRTIGDRK
jgi:BlaI family penicillinase repressor